MPSDSTPDETMPSPLTILYTLIGGLILTALVAWVRRNRLALLVPKLFTYSHLGQLGQLVELTIFNRGFSTEEAVEVFLNPRLSYELVGSTAKNVSITADKLEISRIGASGDVTVILLVEKGQFGATDVLSCMSKQTTGKQYASLELVPPTGTQRVIGLIVFVLLPTLLAVGFLNYSKIWPSSDVASEENGKNEGAPVENPPLGWAADRHSEITGAELYADFIANKLTPLVGPLSFKGDVATVPINLTNSTEEALKFNLEIDSAHSAEDIGFLDRRIFDVLVLPGKSVKKSMKVIIPQVIQDESEKLVFIESRVRRVSNGDVITIKHTLTANR